MSEKKNKSGFRVVPDTNVIISSKLSKRKTSPNKEFNDRWLNHEFALLYSEETQEEYAKKLLEKGIDQETIEELLESLSTIGEFVEIQYYYLPSHLIPSDPDDRYFVLCAENGNATHLVSYDPHLLVLQGKFRFEIVKTVPFLQELRAKLKNLTQP